MSDPSAGPSGDDRTLRSCHLFVFFTFGASLRTWAKVGMLERELALYRRVLPEVARITLVTYGVSDQREFASAIPDFDILCNRYRLPSALYVRALPWLCRLRVHGRPLVKSNQISGAGVAAGAARRLGAPFIARCGYPHAAFARHSNGPDHPATRRALGEERVAFGAAAAIVVTTAEMRESVRADHPIGDTPVAVVPNYVLTDEFAPPPVPFEGRRRVWFVGRLKDQKNPLALIEALAGLDVELHVVGTGALQDQLEARARSLGVELVLHGNVPHRELPALLGTGSLFVLPSHYEGHPKALIEAMACGLPVVAARSPGIAELVHDGEDALLCAPKAEDLRRAIVRLLDDPGLCERLSRAARRRAVDCFSLDNSARLELEVYRRVASCDR
jgi:glycosyltransferase involved in cell wall biosynthesis